jgi:hypothetical protein
VAMAVTMTATTYATFCQLLYTAASAIQLEFHLLTLIQSGNQQGGSYGGGNDDSYGVSFPQFPSYLSHIQTWAFHQCGS